uniref:Uncharacterized protein n=1 Tax=Aegilops tauschii subsp. strangulata TaxID=200361 RepID=A0A453KAB9_AEGTS
MQVMSHFAAKQVLYLFRVKPYLTARLLVVVANNGFQLTFDLHGSNDPAYDELKVTSNVL